MLLITCSLLILKYYRKATLKPRLVQSMEGRKAVRVTLQFIPFRLLSALEELSEALPVVVGEEPIVITQNSFAVSIQEVRPDDFEEGGGQTIIANLGENNQGINLGFNRSSIMKTPPTASLSLPKNLFTLSTSNSTRITNSVFLNDALFLRRSINYRVVGSIILSAGIAGVERVENLTNPPVNLEFQKKAVRASKTHIL